ncbi:MAG: DUF192 domain-containing protein [bacterium]
MGTVKLCFRFDCFTAEIAKTQAQRQQGLMLRESLDQDKAMLFVFETSSVHSFWMKNCLIPLDIIWLDEDYRVLAIKPNNPPCPKTGNCPSINPNVLAKYVLEINAGLSSKIGLQEGSYLSISAATLPTIDK